MQNEGRQVSLGFTDEKFAPGLHVCQIFSEDDERQESLLKFLLSGLQEGERCCCFSEKISVEVLAEFLGNYNISYDEAVSAGLLSLAGSEDVYFEGGRFDPDRSLNAATKAFLNSQARGVPFMRVMGEMSPKIQHMQDGTRMLLEYEARVTMLLRKYPFTAVCQYDAREFDGAVIMDVLKVHPMMIVRGSVVRNPFFVAPEEFLKTQGV